MTKESIRRAARVIGKAGLTAMIVLLLSAVASLAQKPSPIGLWKTIDDDTKEPVSFVRIWVEKGELFGKIEKLIRKPGQNPNPKCEKCEDDKKDQPMVGMTIMWGFKQDDEDTWSGGHILDPDNGKTYKCKLQIVDGGQKLNVRGYIGISLLGRTQTWLRAE